MANKPSGGGIQSNKLVHPSVRTGAGSKGINPGWVSQVGVAMGTHAQESGSRTLNPFDKMHTKDPNFGVKFGNEVALNSKSAPGQGRTIHATGSQGQYGPAAPGNPPPDGPIFPGFPGRRG
jgi:hypothetical protein